MRYPKFLPDNGTIGFAAPALGCNIDPYKSRFDSALKVFADMGYKAVLGPNCYAGEGIGISNTPKACADELMESYLSKDSDVLMSCGGGELMCEILEYMDFDRIAQAEPKWFMGYSDNTNMTYLLTTLCDVASIYGPCAPTFGRLPMHASSSDALALLAGKKSEFSGYPFWERETRIDSAVYPLAPLEDREPKELCMFIGRDSADLTPEGANGITMEGRLIGGCMDCLVNLLGTRFDKTADFLEKYKEDGFIWFLEACDLNVFSIRRAMWQMEQAGWFKYVKGFVIGRPLCYGQAMFGLNHHEAVLKVAGEKNVPVIMDADLGHLPPAMPFVTGAMARISAKGNDITIAYDFR